MEKSKNIYYNYQNSDVNVKKDSDENESKQGLRDIRELLKCQYAIIAGGRSPEGCPIITFPDANNFQELTDEEYRKLMIYITSLPPLQDSDLGFVLVIDRRRDKWSSVKSVLYRISIFFPGSVTTAYVVRPGGLLQKAITEVSNKFFREEFKFKVVICSCEEDLHSYINKTQLCQSLGGDIQYNHMEWLDHRVAVEKFSARTQEISGGLRQFTQVLQASEFPNSVASCEDLLGRQCSEYISLKEDMNSASKSGEALLNCIRFSGGGDPPLPQPPDKMINVTAIERLLVQLEETEKTFHAFWFKHQTKLKECLELRKFEAEFRELQPMMEESVLTMSMMTEVGDSLIRTDELLLETQNYYEDCSPFMERASKLEVVASAMIEKEHYAVDSIRPKCVELIRIRDKFIDLYAQKIRLLQKSRKLQEKVEQANLWCAKGVELLSAQQIDRYQSSKLVQDSLDELQDFLVSPETAEVAEMREGSFLRDQNITPETRALVHQVLKRIDDVRVMCEKRNVSLRKMLSRLPRPIQAVSPEPVIPIQYVRPMGSLGSSVGPRAPLCSGASETSLSLSSKSPRNSLSLKDDSYSVECLGALEAAKAKRGHVLKELLETERVYVKELCSILKGYKDEMLNPEMQTVIPINLYGKADILFGNMEEIFRFHNDVFLRDLQTCINTPELIGLCFVQRKDTFHNLYTLYCQNKAQSEELRRQVGDSNVFFKECQRRLCHKLPLGAYLLKPVQRITKYQLLLKDLMDSMEESQGKRELEEALNTMLSVLKCLNDSMHQVAISGFTGNLSNMGKLLMQGSFYVWAEKKGVKGLRLKPAQRHLFLYEKILLFTKLSGKNSDKEAYQYKNSLKMSQIGLTENVKGDVRKFEVWLSSRQEVYSILPSSIEVKEQWVKEIKKVLLDQFQLLKGENIKQYSSKFQKGLSFNGLANSALSSPTSAHRPLHKTGSWDVVGNTSTSSVSSDQEKGSSFEDGRRSVSAMSSEGGGRTTEEGEVWSSDFSQSEDEEDTKEFSSENSEIRVRARYVVLADYNAMGPSEVSLREESFVDLVKVGCAGWWYVRLAGTSAEGWAPAAYLERFRRNSGSTPSLSSQESSSGVRPSAASRSGSSMASLSTKSEDVVFQSDKCRY